MITGGFDLADKQAVISRVVEWQGLRRAEKLTRLLVCLYEQADGPPLTEKELAARLFPRPAGHDYADDSIVRVSMRQLRMKLQEYFAGPGAQEPYVIEIPKGEYALRFLVRHIEPAPALVVAVPPPPEPTARWRWIAAGLGLLLTGVVAGFAVGQSGAHDLPNNLLVKAMDGGTYSLTIVPGDAPNRLLMDVIGSDVQVGTYLSGPPPAPVEIAGNRVAERLYRWFLTDRYFSSSHASAAAAMLGSVGELRSRAAVRHPRELTVRALQQNSYALMAARFMNPLVDLFESRLTLQCINEGPNRQIGVTDTLAKGQERQRYIVEGSSTKTSYARIALVPNLGADGGRVLLLSGLGSEGTEAASMVALDPKWRRTIEEKLPSGQVYFEALVEARATSRSPVELQLVLVRPVNPK